jgi:hypothetical protein
MSTPRMSTAVGQLGELGAPCREPLMAADGLDGCAWRKGPLRRGKIVGYDGPFRESPGETRERTG